MGLVKPIIPLQEEFQGDLDAYQEAMVNIRKTIVDFQQKREEVFRATLEAGKCLRELLV